MFGDDAKLPSSNRISIGNIFNQLQNGVAFYGDTSSGASNLYQLNFTDAPSALVDGQRFYFIADKNNSGAITVSYDGALTAALYDRTGLAQISFPNVVRAGDVVDVVYDGSKFRLVSAKQQDIDGWQRLPLVGTYISSTSFSIPGDWTTQLFVGMPVKVLNSTVKYGNILSFSFGSGVTTLVLIPNATYSIANTTIPEVYLSRNITAQGMPTWFSWNNLGTITGVSATAIHSIDISVIGISKMLVLLHLQGTSNANNFRYTPPSPVTFVHSNVETQNKAGYGIDGGGYAGDCTIGTEAGQPYLRFIISGGVTSWNATATNKAIQGQINLRFS